MIPKLLKNLIGKKVSVNGSVGILQHAGRWDFRIGEFRFRSKAVRAIRHGYSDLTEIRV